jgi:hypothetical protein
MKNVCVYIWNQYFETIFFFFKFAFNYVAINY